MLRSFDPKNRRQDNVENYTWIIPPAFGNEGFYYNSFGKHGVLNPKNSWPGKYGYNRKEAIEG